MSKRMTYMIDYVIMKPTSIYVDLTGYRTPILWDLTYTPYRIENTDNIAHD